MTVSGVISGSNGLTKGGTADLILSGANTYSGVTTVNAGQISFASAAAFGNSDSFVFNGGAATTTPVSDRAGLSYTGTGPVTLSQNITVNGGLAEFLGTSTSTFELAGVISGAGGLYFSTSGANYILSGVNTYTGQTRIFNSTVSFSSDANLGAASAGLDIGSGASSGVRLLGDWTTSRTINISFGSLMDTNGFDTVWNGTFTGASALTKSGLGDWVINTTDTNWSGGLTISAGRVLVNGLLATSASSVSVASGSTLGGSGVINRTVTVASGGILSPGTDGPGVLTINGNLTMNAGSIFELNLDGSVAGSGYDQLVVGEFVTVAPNINGATLTGSTGYVPFDVDALVIIDNLSSFAINGTFAGLAEGAFVALGAVTWQITYVGGTGNDVVLFNPNPSVPIPEPTTWAMLAMGGLLGAIAAGRHRRR